MSVKAQTIAKAILDNIFELDDISDRKGVGDELDYIDDDIKEEMLSELVELIDFILDA